MKSLSKVAIWLLIVGLVLCAVGFAFGANYGMYRDKTGWHLIENELNIDEQKYDNISRLSIKAGNARIEVRKGTEYSVSVEYCYTKPTIAYEDGQLNINFKSYNTWSMGFYVPNEKVIVTLPEDAELDYAYINNDNGSINVEKLTAKDAEINNDNGSITVGNVISDRLHIENHNGRIELSNIATSKLNVGNDNGSIKLNKIQSDTGKIGTHNGSIKGDDIKGKNEFTNDNGSIEITVFDLRSYYKKLSTQNGSMRINGEKVVWPVDGNPDSENQIIARTSNGSIKIWEMIE